MELYQLLALPPHAFDRVWRLVIQGAKGGDFQNMATAVVEKLERLGASGEAIQVAKRTEVGR